jgi:hypothetical protein
LDPRRSTGTRNLGKSRSTTRPGRIPFWAVRCVLGLVLIAAGALKLYDLTFEAKDESTPTLLLMFFSEAELLGGLWMVGGFASERTYWWAVAGFAGLGASSLIQALDGKCSCGCFGGLSVNPWFALLFDLAAIAAMLGFRPPRDSEEEPLTQPLRFLGPVILALVVVAVGSRQADLVSLAGTAMADDRPLDQAILRFTGDSGIIDVRTDHDGLFRLPLVRPGFYAVSVPGRVVSPKPEPADRGPGKKKGARRSEQKSPSPSQSGGSELIVWVELSKCSESRKIIEFK